MPKDPSKPIHSGAAPPKESGRTGTVPAELLARMGHELRTPLNAILGFVRLVEDGLYTTDDERRDYLASARHSALSLLDLINNILDLARIESGRLSLESVDLKVTDLVEEVARTLAPEAHAKGVEIEAIIHPAVPVWLKSDPIRLRQVLYNLAGNAVKFTAQGLVTVSVEVEADDPEAGCGLRFTVHDTGIGVPDEIGAEIFESFVQKHRPGSPTTGGVGLGLSISRQIVEQMGGRIEFRSQANAGSTFWFSLTLPRGRSHAPAAAAATASEVLRGRRALLVDTDAQTRVIYRDRLQRLGLRVDAVAGADEALRCVRDAAEAQDPIPLVLVDQHMRRDDMLVLARALRREASWAPQSLISLAPVGAVGNIASLREAGVTAFLTKPAMLETLRAFLTNQLQVRTHAGRDATTGAAPRKQGQAACVLVAEDNLVNQKLIQALLSKEGYAVRIVPNGRDAVEAVRTEQIDLVLMDVQMPVLDGLAATRAIRQLPEQVQVPIIAMTADGLDGDRERCLGAGMDDYLPKPIMPDLLYEKLRQWLNRPREQASSGNGAAAVPTESLLDDSHLDAVRAYAGAHDPQRFEAWVDLFRAELRAALSVLADPALRESPEALQAVARQLTQASAGFGAPRVLAVARRLARSSTTLTPTERAALVRELESTVLGVQAALSERASSA